MNTANQKLLLEQIDKKLSMLKPLKKNSIPERGWIYIIRTALRMSLRQLGKKLNITSQSAKEIEQREANGTITMNTLKAAANAMGMNLVYGFIPREESLETMIEKRSYEIAREIVMRTSGNMKLEDQENSGERLNKAIKNRAEDIKYTMPRYLWD